MKYLKGQTVAIPPDKARELGGKVKLVDMKKSLYRVLEDCEPPKPQKKVKSESRKATDQG